MKIQILLELSQYTLKLCGISLRIAWNKGENRSIHPFWKYFEVKKRCIERSIEEKYKLIDDEGSIGGHGEGEL